MKENEANRTELTKQTQLAQLSAEELDTVNGGGIANAGWWHYRPLVNHPRPGGIANRRRR